MLKEKSEKSFKGGGFQLCLLFNLMVGKVVVSTFKHFCTFCCFHPYQGKGSNWISIFLKWIGSIQPTTGLGKGSDLIKHFSQTRLKRSP